MSNIRVRRVEVSGFEQFIATLRLASGVIIEIASASEEDAIAQVEEVEEEASFLEAPSYNPNAGLSFDKDEEDYYS
jgi:hypothetical protein